VLKATVQAIQAHIKRADFVGRWGGEEFAIGLRGANIAGAMQVAARIRETLAHTRVQDSSGQSIPPPTASQGIAALVETARGVDELIEQADRALYRAKSRGRDQIAAAEAAGTAVANRSINSRMNDMPSK
jgi:diguanylate cyclase